MLVPYLTANTPLSLERKCTKSLRVITSGTEDKHLALHRIALTVT